MASIGRAGGDAPRTHAFWNRHNDDRDVQRSLARTAFSRWDDSAPLDRFAAELETRIDGARDEAFGDWNGCDEFDRLAAALGAR
jgi:hypothetical protein